jgi:hypothetical protein
MFSYALLYHIYMQLGWSSYVFSHTLSNIILIILSFNFPKLVIITKHVLEVQELACE